MQLGHMRLSTSFKSEDTRLSSYSSSWSVRYYLLCQPDVTQGELIDMQAPVLFTAAIDMTLNVMVRDFPKTDCLLLLRPRTVLISMSSSQTPHGCRQY